MNARRLTLVIGPLIVAAVATRCAADEEQQQGITAKIIAYGLYSSETLGAVPTTDESSGSVKLLGTPAVHVRTTHKVPCRVGETFGFTVDLHGLKPGQEYVLHTVTKHPSIVQPDGRTLKKSTSQQVVTAPAADATYFKGWGFETGYEYELVKGRWTLSVSIGDEPPVEMSFDVVDPDVADQAEEDPEPE